MAKIGTAHLEIKPVVNDEALAQITAAIEKAVAAGVEAGMRAASVEPPQQTFHVYSAAMDTWFEEKRPKSAGPFQESRR